MEPIKRTLISSWAAIASIIVMTILFVLPCYGVNWQTVSAIALVLTLGVVAIYTKSSYDMAKYQGQEIGLHRHPVVTVQYWRSEELEVIPEREFFTSVRNLSHVHARARIRASLYAPHSGEWIELWTFHEAKEQYFYSGVREWTLQAQSEFRGCLGLPEILETLNPDNPTPDLINHWIRIESWVSNHEDRLEFGKPPTEPVLYWTWRRSRWEPEPNFSSDAESG